VALEDLFDRGCARCGLSANARTVCLGNRGQEEQPLLVLFGESPGKDEDSFGQPFVGRAGQLLDKLLEQAGVDPQRVMWTNAVRCFAQTAQGTPRQPTDGEVSACLLYTYRLLERLLAVNPAHPPLLVALGNTALKALTGKGAITRNRGLEFPLAVHPAYRREFEHLNGCFQVVGTIHPSAALRTESYAPSIVADLARIWRRVTGQFEDRYWDQYIWVNDPQIFADFVDEAILQYRAGEIPWVAYDLETTGLNVYDRSHKTVCFSVSKGPKQALVVPLWHQDSPWKEDRFIQDRILSDLGRLLATVPVCGWNLSFDIKWSLLHLGVQIREIGLDGFLARKWMNSSKTISNDLNTAAEGELGFIGHGLEMKPFTKSVTGEAGNRMHDCPSDKMLRYSGGDADASFQLCVRYRDKLAEIDSLENFSTLILKGMLPVCRMEIAGVAVNPATTAYLMELYPKEMEPHIQAVEQTEWGRKTKAWLAARIDERGKPAPLEFNLRSPQTLQRLLYHEMSLPVVAQGKSGPSSAKESLEDLIEICNDRGWPDRREVLEHLNEWRTLAHTFSNFVKKMSEHTAADGFFHTNYNIIGTVTGRFSSSDPSIHTQPKGSKARWQFVSRWAKQGGLIVSADMKQMEMRVLAALSQDANLCQTILSGVDIHTANAAQMFGVPHSAVTKEQRQIAKTLGFAVVYGSGPGNLAAQLEISKDRAQGIIDNWYQTFPGTLEYQRSEYKMAVKYGCVTTDFGRIIWIPDITTSRWGDRAWRQAINARIQSTASDTTLMALLEVDAEILARGLRSKLFGFVHDAILVDVAPGELLDILDIQKTKMVDWINHEFVGWLKEIPVVSDIELCPGWGFPCSLVERNGQRLVVESSVMHGTLLLSELRHLHAEIVEQKVEGDKMLIDFVLPSMAAQGVA